MLAKRFADARPYEAPNHRGVVGLRLQGFEDGGPQNQWVGLSQFLPGGGAEVQFGGDEILPAPLCRFDDRIFDTGHVIDRHRSPLPQRRKRRHGVGVGGANPHIRGCNANRIGDTPRHPPAEVLRHADVLGA